MDPGKISPKRQATVTDHMHFQNGWLLLQNICRGYLHSHKQGIKHLDAMEKEKKVWFFMFFNFQIYD